MNIYNKWFMRASCEGKHQPSCHSEARVRANVDLLLTYDWFRGTCTIN